MECRWRTEGADGGRNMEKKETIGLTSREVRERVEQGLVNGEEEIQSKSFGEILWTNLVTPFNILNVILAALILLVGSFKNMLFMGVILSNAVIGTVQEIRAKRLIDKLSLITEPKARVIRDGIVQTIRVEELVMDDVMLLEAGSQVCADCRVLTGSCETNESLITGEQDPILKRSGDQVLSGSFVVSGAARVQVIHVGADNYASQISRNAKYLKRPNSQILASINRLIKVIGFSIVPVGAALFCTEILGGVPRNEAVVSTVASMVGMIPEGLVLLTSVVFAVGVVRLGRRKALVQEMYSIETLARVDVLCLDKTGTITTGEMQVDRLHPLPGHSREEAWNGAAALVSALEDHNPTAEAVRKFCATAPSWKPGAMVPFSSARKWSGVTFPGRGTYVMGAEQFLFPAGIPEAQEIMEEAAGRGQRVLVLAVSSHPFQGQELPEQLEPVALILISDRIREHAERTLRYFAEQGVTLKVISGDDARTVSRIAQRVGLAGAERYVDASTLREEELARAAEQYTVFGRVTPQQKRQLVQGLKENHTVAMTGDGVNDVLALKESDCSIAMAAGSDAARAVSQMVLLDSDFASMPYIVAEGRRSINNLQRSASLFLVKTFFSTIIALVFIFLSAPYPFEPIQFTLVSALTIGAPSFVLAMEPNRERVRGRFLWNVIRKAIPGALTNVFNTVLLVLVAGRMGFHSEQISTMAVVLMGYTGMMILFKVCVPFTWQRILLFCAMGGAFVLAFLFLGDLFSLERLTLGMVGLLIPLLAAATAVFLTLLMLTAAFLERRGK